MGAKELIEERDEQLKLFTKAWAEHGIKMTTGVTEWSVISAYIKRMEEALEIIVEDSSDVVDVDKARQALASGGDNGTK